MGPNSVPRRPLGARPTFAVVAPSTHGGHYTIQTRYVTQSQMTHNRGRPSAVGCGPATLSLACGRNARNWESVAPALCGRAIGLASRYILQ